MINLQQTFWKINMYTVVIKYKDQHTFLKKITLANLKHFLKEKKYKKPYTPLETYLIQYALETAFKTTQEGIKVQYFEIES